MAWTMPVVSHIAPTGVPFLFSLENQRGRVLSSAGTRRISAHMRNQDSRAPISEIARPAAMNLAPQGPTAAVSTPLVEGSGMAAISSRGAMP